MGIIAEIWGAGELTADEVKVKESAVFMKLVSESKINTLTFIFISLHKIIPISGDSEGQAALRFLRHLLVPFVPPMLHLGSGACVNYFNPFLSLQLWSSLRLELGLPAGF